MSANPLTLLARLAVKGVEAIVQYCNTPLDEAIDLNSNAPEKGRGGGLPGLAKLATICEDSEEGASLPPAQEQHQHPDGVKKENGARKSERPVVEFYRHNNEIMAPRCAPHGFSSRRQNKSSQHTR